MIRKKQQKVNRKQIILAPKKKWEVKAHYLQESQRQIKGLEATTVALKRRGQKNGPSLQQPMTHTVSTVQFVIAMLAVSTKAEPMLSAT